MVVTTPNTGNDIRSWDQRRRRSTNVSNASRHQPSTWSMSELYYDI
jgi:hypothetical protein